MEIGFTGEGSWKQHKTFSGKALCFFGLQSLRSTLKVKT
jgi:hypothetical protein